MSDEFWTPDEDAEFAQAERDDAAAEQAAEDQFPAGWTEVGVTTESIQFGGGIVAGPARLYTQPVTNPIFEAIDRASEDRTPVIETTVSPGNSWIRLQKALSDAAASFAETLTMIAEAVSATCDTLLAAYGGPLTPQRHQVALIGTGYRRHRATRGRRTELDLSRAEHARRRRLHSERLRRDRRRRRAGRSPILRSSSFETLIPHAQVDVTKAGPEYYGMEIVASPMVPEDQAWIVDGDLLKHRLFVEPKVFEKPRSRYADQVALYASTWARYGSPTGRMHRATNYLIQADAVAREESGLWNGPVVIAIDETADWAPEHTEDVDRWLNEGGAR